MTNRIYTSSMGRKVDMGALVLQNEKTRAVGNMNVNARGDRIDVNGQSLVTRAQQINKNLQKQRQTAQPEPVMTRQVPAKNTEPETETQDSGIAAAVNRARKRKQ